MHTTMKVKQNKIKINLFFSICIEHTCTKVILIFTGDRLKAGRIILHFKDMLDTTLFKLYAIIITVFVTYAATMSRIIRITTNCTLLSLTYTNLIITHLIQRRYEWTFQYVFLNNIMQINIKQLPCHTFILGTISFKV